MNLNFTLVIQIVSFLILLGLLTKFFYRPFMNYLDTRAKGIKDMIEESQKNREIAQQEFQNAKDELQKAKHHVIEMKNSVIKEADEHRRFTIEQAKQEAASLLERAKLEVKQELASAKSSLKSDIASLSIEIARKILEREVKDKDHKKLIEDSIKELSNG